MDGTFFSIISCALKEHHVRTRLDIFLFSYVPYDAIMFWMLLSCNYLIFFAIIDVILDSVFMRL